MSEREASGGGRRVVLVLFFASGLSALIYQVIWLRSLATVFGSTVYATTTVLASFMGGLALGSWILGKRADRSARPLALYGILEIGIGVFALSFPLILGLLDDLYVALHRQVELSFYGLSLVRFVVCSAVLIVPTTLMGGTFPIMNRYYVRRYKSLAANVSLLYGLNTFGAVFGVVLTAFVFMEQLGIFRTSLVAIAINLLVGIVAIALEKRYPAAPPESAHDEPAAKKRGGTRVARGGGDKRRLIIIAAFLSGMAALAYEVIWTRTLVFVLDSFVYSFSIMLATFLIGIAVGSLIISPISPRIRQGYTLLAVLFVLVGFSAVATMPFFARLALWKTSYLSSLSQNISLDTPAPWGEYIAFKFLISALIMLVPALLMGAAFPLAIKLYLSTLRGIGQKIGTVYAVNTLGAILGAFLTGFVLIPAAGLRNSLVVVACLSLLTGVMLFAFERSRRAPQRLLRVVVPVALFALCVSLIPRDLYERVFQQGQKTFDLVHYREDATATVTVHRRADRVIINLNGLNVAGTHFNFLTTQKMQAHLGLLLHPDPKRVLQIGFGSGGTCWSVSRHEGVEAIDCVELCQGVIDAAKYFIPSNHRVLENPKVTLRIEDARNYILATEKRYDLILSDSIHPAYAGNGTLYSQDYFELCREKLNPGGYVSFWMPTYMLSPREYKTTIKTFQSVFPNVSIWYVSSAIEAYTIVIGRIEPFTIDLERLRARLAAPAVARDLAQVEVHDVRDVLGYFVMGPERARRYAAGGDINTDDHPVIELRGPKSMTRRRTWYQNLRDLAAMREPVAPYLAGAGASDTLATDLTRLYRATGEVIEGQLLDVISYDYEGQYRHYEAADRIYPGNRAIQRLKALTMSKVLAFRAEELVRQGRRDQAIATYERAIAVNPDPTDDTVGHAHFRIGFLLLQKQEVQRGLEEMRKCLAVLPAHKQALLLSATVELRSRRYPEARAKIDKLLRLFPGDDEAEELRRQLRDAAG